MSVPFGFGEGQYLLEEISPKVTQRLTSTPSALSVGSSVAGISHQLIGEYLCFRRTSPDQNWSPIHPPTAELLAANPCFVEELLQARGKFILILKCLPETHGANWKLDVGEVDLSVSPLNYYLRGISRIRNSPPRHRRFFKHLPQTTQSPG